MVSLAGTQGGALSFTLLIVVLVLLGCFVYVYLDPLRRVGLFLTQLVVMLLSLWGVLLSVSLSPLSRPVGVRLTLSLGLGWTGGGWLIVY